LDPGEECARVREERGVVQAGRGVAEVSHQLIRQGDPAALEEGDDPGRQAEAGARREQARIR
jgi:hypothetical protein